MPPYTKTTDLRQTFIDYFRDLDHKIYPSAPLIPTNDPSLLFTVAGMVQFKDALIGVETPEVARAASCQLCMRAGGKHNDLENVGYTARHHTLFEMLGNFSFGDYFKEEAINWAWKFVIDYLHLDPERIWITVHTSDDEAREIWIKKIGIREKRVVGHEANFWEMGETGPCGPNSEIFYDQGPTVEGGPPGSKDEDGDRFLEFWNLVFPQFDRQPDGELQPLANPGIDTGLGLERTAALMQNVTNNYGIDIFKQLVSQISRIIGAQVAESASHRVIADHIRSSAFLVADGVLPSNEGRGYVLRRIIRRALRHGYKLGIEGAFFSSLTKPLVECMGETYTILVEKQQIIQTALQEEEEKFSETLRNGMALLQREVQSLTTSTLSGDVAFKLYDTYGFPVDLTEDFAREIGITVDNQRFEELMELQRTRARSASAFDTNTADKLRFDSSVEFIGYDPLGCSSVILALYSKDLDALEFLNEGDFGVLVVDKTCFYGEAGGQVGDTGEFVMDSAVFRVEDTIRMDRQFLHKGKVVQGGFKCGDTVNGQVDARRRQDITRNHTGTHLLHAALKMVLGDEVQQRGSLVAPDRLRFDFSHKQPLKPAEIEELERLVNEHIALNSLVNSQLLPFDDAKELGAVALFGEKYGDIVRVLETGNGFSLELCGGTHTSRTGEIGCFRIIAQEGIAAGVRRIEAVTGRKAAERFMEDGRLLRQLSDTLQVSSQDLGARVQALIEDNKRLQKASKQIAKQQDTGLGRDLAKSAKKINGIAVVAAEIQGDSNTLMSLYDDVVSRLPEHIVLLAMIHDGKIQLVCGVSKKLTAEYQANKLLQSVAEQVGARGGGRAEMARAGGGDNIAALPQALASIEKLIKNP
ncbi:MAG: alanine--tRNA ligase [Gammaproteobacteria bacterium]|nr:alanine--tRNA ligase [Gammaproteobacteria bacterium]MYF53417.1 alanine--tRNA ligase [Gammaproteobacteria bacterium]MYK43495.1 alanine--tRNA ligase [Gammaproteobacteria bacterium]